MKLFICTLVFAFVAPLAIAQQGRTHIQQDKKIDDLIAIYKTLNSSEEFYRIQVGFGPLSTAERIKAEVDTDFPELPSKIDFDSPTYRVRVGKFKNKLDAERKFIEVRAKYPDAMLLKPKKST